MPRAKRPSELLQPGEYEELLAKQGGVCALCKQPPIARRLDVDHNHRTGQVRGLLHFRCNKALPSERMLPGGITLGAYLFAALCYVAEYEAAPLDEMSGL